VTRFFVVQDCGQIINPDGVRAQLEGNIIQTVSRTLKERVTFDRSRVTSVDWASYPILTFPEVPEIHMDLIDRPRSHGALASRRLPSYRRPSRMRSTMPSHPPPLRAVHA
jgi:CO/xanthine dehydrogenase Mo-binding subunit